MNLSDEVVEKMRNGEVKPDFDNPPVLTDEEKKKHMIQEATRLDIIRKANEYIKTPIEERESKKYLLQEIQEIVDLLEDAFVLVVPQKDGAAYSITFNPHEEMKENK